MRTMVSSVENMPVEGTEYLLSAGNFVLIWVGKVYTEMDCNSLSLAVASPLPLSCILDKQVARGFLRRDEKFLEKVFQHYSRLHTSTAPTVEQLKSEQLKMSRKHASSALADCGVFVAEKSEPDLLRSIGVSHGTDLEFADFKRAVEKPSAVEEWTRSLPLAQVLADAMPRMANRDPLRTISELDIIEQQTVTEAFFKGATKLLSEKIQELRNAFKRMDDKASQHENNQSEKFKVVSMKCGLVADYHKGLAERIGAPHLDFEVAMCAEHCKKRGRDKEFTTTNYNITTTPKQEWAIVVERKKPRKEMMRHGREIPRIEELLQKEVCRKSNLTKAEVIAVVLYSGPMYMVYNTILRRYPDEEYKFFHDRGNVFTTTIFALVSAVQKIARSTPLPENLMLYRGLGGLVDLPEHFFKADDRGCRGFAEWGFMSTTQKKSVAIDFSGVRSKNPRPMVLVTRTSSVDRGACIKDFSQYPMEVEYLWVPCSFVEADGSPYLEITEDGIVTMVPVRINANLKAMTVGELLSNKKNMHLSSFEFLVDELKRDLTTRVEEDAAVKRTKKDSHAFNVEKYTLSGFVEHIINDCTSILHKHKELDEQHYLDDDVFRFLVVESLDVKKMAKSKLEWWLSSSESITYVQPCKMRRAHREWIMILQRELEKKRGAEKAVKALDLCKKKGLIRDAVDEEHDGEVSFLKSAAEGAKQSDLQLLITAKASINDHTEDGRTAVILAAHNGHTETVRALNALGADIRARKNDGGTALMSAAQNGHLNTIKELCALRADVSETKNDGWTAVMSAAYNGRRQTIKVLLELGADVCASTHDGTNALISAAQNGHCDTVRVLHELKADVNSAMQDGTTALMLAASNGHCNTIKTLVELSANINAKKLDGVTAVMLAAYNGNVFAVKALHEVKADLNATKNDGGTAIMAAASFGHANTIRQLVTLNADVRACKDDGWSAVMAAARTGQQKCIKVLFDLKANVGATKTNGWTAVMSASQYGHSQTVKLLKELGANVNAMKCDGGTAVMLAAQNRHWETVAVLHKLGLITAAEQGDCEAVHVLCALGADSNSYLEYGWTAVIVAAANRKCDTIKVLHQLGADVNKPMHDCWTAVMSAAQNGDCSCISLLHSLNANVSRSMNGGFTAVMIAADHGHCQAIKTLVALGAGVDGSVWKITDKESRWASLAAAVRKSHSKMSLRVITTDLKFLKASSTTDGWTAVMAAAQSGHSEAIKTLRELGADVNLATEDGWTAVMSAAQHGNCECIRTLHSVGSKIEATKSDGATALIVAAQFGREGTIRTLHELNADVNVTMIDGQTAVMAAASNGHD